MTSTLRWLLAGAIIAGIHGGVAIITAGGLPVETRQPQEDVARLPRSFDAWVGEDAELDPELFRTTDEAQAINRVYRRGPREEVLTHLMVLCSDNPTTSHMPELCYPGSGWELAGEETLPVEVTSGRTIRVRLLRFEREGHSIQVLYWYRFGDEVVFSHTDVRRVRYKMRGQEAWPPVVKVMLQSNDPDLVRGREALVELAGPIAAWIERL